MILQMFDSSPDELSIFAIWQALNGYLANDVNSFHQAYDNSVELGQALYNGNAMPAYMLVGQSAFIRAYGVIAQHQITNGAVDSILSILYALFGADAIISVDTTPMHIVISVVSVASHAPEWIAKDGASMTDMANNFFVFKQLLQDVPASGLANMLLTLVNAGTCVDFNLQIGGD